jgi:hypothetical protein
MTNRDFKQVMQMLTGAWVTQIAGAVGTHSIADHLAKGPATAEQIAALEGIDRNGLSACCAPVLHSGWQP